MLHRLMKPKTGSSETETIWLTVYGDLITNLMLVFLALFALVLMGDNALMQAMESMKFDQIKPLPFEQLRQNDSITLDAVTVSMQEELKNIPGVSVIKDEDATHIGFGEDLLFRSGQAVLKPESIEVLSRIGNILELLPFTIVVEGHTDNVPLRPGSQYRNNWELSLARSLAVVKILSKESQMPVSKFATAAYGSFKPIASNLTASGRQLNRRVEVALYKDFPHGL